MPQIQAQAHAHSYDPVLVILSITIAIFASGAALDLAGRIAAAEGTARRWWFSAGAIAMGIGIWSMHYTGMLALRLPITVMYHGLTVLLSLAVAVLASALALGLAARGRWSNTTWAAGSVVFGCGIAAMHYIGMAAMRLPASMEWNAWRIAASVIIAIVVSAVALRLAFHHGHGETQGWGWYKLGSAVLMGFAIFSMHHTGMSAVTYNAAPMPFSTTGSLSIPLLGAWAIVAATATVLAAAVASSFIDRYIKQMKQYHQALAEVRTLRGLLSICAECKKIRREDGEWERVESYVRSRTEAEFSHGLCPTCHDRWTEVNLPQA
jgi:two-component system sensor histidine kinase/response regulator